MAIHKIQAIIQIIITILLFSVTIVIGPIPFSWGLWIYCTMILTYSIWVWNFSDRQESNLLL